MVINYLFSAETVGKETVTFLMQRVQSAQMSMHRPFKNTAGVRFEELNKQLNLKFNLEIYHKLLDLKDKVFKSLGIKSVWSGSVNQLYEVL